jgi:hypothetical protein
MKLDDAIAHARRVTAELHKMPDPYARAEALALNAELLVREARCDAMLALADQLESDGRPNAARWVVQQLRPEYEQLQIAIAQAQGMAVVRLN